MKIKRHEVPEGFQPVEITITLESIEEVRDLWHRCNMSGRSLDGHPYTPCGTGVPLPVVKTCSGLWHVLNRLLRNDDD